jgi:hypothetical protein
MSQLTVDQPIRAFQDQLAAQHPDPACYYGMCPHEDLPDPVLPGGVQAIHITDYDTTPWRTVVTLVRFKARILGKDRFRQGWFVVRADNGRELGWLCKQDDGEHKGLWSIRVCVSAFRGDGPDDDGNVMDRVPHHLYNGTADGSSSAHAIGYARDRTEAAAEIVARLVQRRAPAVGYGPRYDVTVYHSRPRDHFAIGEGNDERCLCSEAWPCPKRAALEAELAGAR